MTEPITTPPIAAAPVAAAPAPTAVPVGLPPAFGQPPKIGNIAGPSSGIPEEDFGKPAIIRVLSVSRQTLKYEEGQADVPTVDYIVLDPATGESVERRGVVIRQKNIRNKIIDQHVRGYQVMTGVFLQVPSNYSQPAKVLNPLDDTNSGYGVEKATEYLKAAAVSFGWWGAA